MGCLFGQLVSPEVIKAALSHSIHTHTQLRPRTHTHTHMHTHTHTHTHTSTKDCNVTEDTGDEAEGELGGEEREEPGRGVQAGADLLLLQVVVEFPVVVMQQPRQLVHLNLRGAGGRKEREREREREERERESERRVLKMEA